MNRKQRIIISVTGIFIVLLILVGLTYAYFLTRIQGNTNTKSISVTTADLKLTYGDGNGDITAEKIQPGTTIDTKTFTVKNEGNATLNNYAVYLEELVNTLSRTSDMVYTLTCTSSVTGKTCNGKTETSFPTQNGLLVTNNIDVNETQSYELKVVYKEMNIDQSEDMNKTIGAKVQIYNLSDIVDITGNVTNATTGDYIEMQSTPKTSQIRDNKYFIPAVEPGTHTLYVKDSRGTVKGSKKITINKGSTSSVNGDVITVTSDSQTISINITNISSTLTTNIGDVKDFSPFSDGTLANAIYTSAKQGGTNRTTYGSEVTTFTKISGENDKLLNTAPDDYGTSYYYYGAVTDNYVSFANKLWRVVRINGDGSIRLVLDDVAKDSSGNVIKTAFNTNYNDNAYVGYMYGTVGSTTYDATHKNINDSTIKTKVDKWYEDNLKTNYANYLSDTLFCNDKTLASNGIGGVTTQLGYGTNKTYYASTERLQYSTGTTNITTAKPTFKCAESATNDYSRFTVSVATLPTGNKTNGNLKYPIGLLSADEVSYAGAYKSGQTNKTYYLYNSSITFYWWFSSPRGYTGSYADDWLVHGSDGGIYNNSVNGTFAFRPSINLKAELLVNGGDGTKSSPYKVN